MGLGVQSMKSQEGEGREGDGTKGVCQWLGRG